MTLGAPWNPSACTDAKGDFRLAAVLVSIMICNRHDGNSSTRCLTNLEPVCTQWVPDKPYPNRQFMPSRPQAAPNSLSAAPPSVKIRVKLGVRGYVNTKRTRPGSPHDGFRVSCSQASSRRLNVRPGHRRLRSVAV